MNSAQPFILTLRLEPALAATLTVLRRAHFPEERNYLDAHVTLFHALPSSQEATLRRDLNDICTQAQTFNVGFPELKHWGKGVFVRLESPDLLEVREKLAERWHDYLTPQDQQSYRPHVTVQNKVPKDEAKALYETLAPSWQPLTGKALGLSLWRYAGGPWTFAEPFEFTG